MRNWVDESGRSWESKASLGLPGSQPEAGKNPRGEEGREVRRTRSSGGRGALAAPPVAVLLLPLAFPAAARVTRDARSGWGTGAGWGRALGHVAPSADLTSPRASAVGLGRLAAQGGPPGGGRDRREPGEARFLPKRFRIPETSDSPERPAALLHPPGGPHRRPRGTRGLSEEAPAVRVAGHAVYTPDRSCRTARFRNRASAQAPRTDWDRGEVFSSVRALMS